MASHMLHSWSPFSEVTPDYYTSSQDSIQFDHVTAMKTIRNLNRKSKLDCHFANVVIRRIETQNQGEYERMLDSLGRDAFMHETRLFNVTNRNCFFWSADVLNFSKCSEISDVLINDPSCFCHSIDQTFTTNDDSNKCSWKMEPWKQQQSKGRKNQQQEPFIHLKDGEQEQASESLFSHPGPEWRTNVLAKQSSHCAQMFAEDLVRRCCSGNCVLNMEIMEC